MTMQPINWLAVLVCGILAMVIGFFWYSKWMFGTAWGKYTGWTEEKIQEMASSNMGITYGGAFVLSLVLAAALANILALMAPTSLIAAVLISLVMWIGFVAATQGVHYLFEHRSFAWFLMDSGYHLAQMIVFSIILYLWK